MDLVSLFAEYVPWSWIVSGLVLLAIELIAPGGVFVWLGAAAVVTGLITMVPPLAVFGSLMPLGLPTQFAIFSGLSILTLVGWIRMRSRIQPETDSPFLNNRVGRYVGEEGFLSEPILGQSGRMELGESVWRVTGPELPAGHRVRVVGYKGNVLRVESAQDDQVASA